MDLIKIKKYVYRLIRIADIFNWSLLKSIRAQGLSSTIEKLRKYVPDITDQELTAKTAGFYELKRRGMHAFQLKLMNQIVRNAQLFSPSKELIVVDIGDSAGTHMTYLKKDNPERTIRSISVNLCEEEVENIKRKGMEAILCRAENLDLGDKKIDLFVSFEMVEHLHNPALFFKKIAQKGNSEYMIITVPYLKKSRVALHNVRLMRKTGIFPKDKLSAETEHIFEFSPEDWELLILHSGWKTIGKGIYYQYDRKSLLAPIFGRLWERGDYRGFLGLILKRDTRFMETYGDWEE